MKVRIEGVNGRTQKIPAIKMVRAMTGWGLKESKDFVEAAPMDAGGMIALTLMPAMANVNNVADLEVALRRDQYNASFDRIVDLDAIPAPKRLTIAYLSRELAEAKQALESTMKSLAIARADNKAAYDRMETERREFWANRENGDRAIRENEILRESCEQIGKERAKLIEENRKLRGTVNDTCARIVMGGKEILISNGGVNITDIRREDIPADDEIDESRY